MTEEQLPGGGIVFGIGRRKTQGQLAKAELSQGIGHLRQAASYAAKGAGASVGPRVQAARGAVAPTAIIVRDRASSRVASTAAALAPLVLAMRNAQAEAAGKSGKGRKAAARQAAVTKQLKAKNLKAARKKQQRSRGMMAGLLAAGTVAGLAGAMAMRRRREQLEWAEYDPTGKLAPMGEDKLEPMREDVDTIVVETPDPTAKVTQAGPSGAGGPVLAGGDAAASTARSSSQPVIQPNDKVPSIAEGARDVSGRPADDVTRATANGKGNARAGGRR
ncbi:hypothetical protein Q2K19_11930 [Micromonospora soli]|uniref:hypothetical protein n=1 Tax=Micromonospora sp. NBRC 110009 TaxID=3061627 RepID=UPI002672BE1D|nr:hypothetical protein [Micromonospora sp. NBRC 110009]WKU01123.1 hypothetical protein Q2K19_11930 [Micromonospora sp. NBRC 110009]